MSTITWTCEVCKRSIADSKGGVFVRISERRAYREGQDELKRKGRVVGPDPKTGRSLVVTSVADLMDAADAARWHTMHHKCDPTPSDCAYWFDVSRVRTEYDVLSMTHHLLGKAWLDETSWGDLIGRVLYPAAQPTADPS